MGCGLVDTILSLMVLARLRDTSGGSHCKLPAVSIRQCFLIMFDTWDDAALKVVTQVRGG